MCILFISGSEIFVVLLVVLLFFGADKIPDIARMMGKGMSEFRKATDDIKREFETSTDDIQQEVNNFAEKLHNEEQKTDDDINKKENKNV